MPPEWNTRSMVEVPELLVSGLLHESDWPTFLGAFNRATLSKIIWLSQGARPWPKFPANGMTWACAAAGRRTHRERRRRAVWWPGSHAYLLHVFGANALRQYAYAPSAAASASPVVMVQLKPKFFPGGLGRPEEKLPIHHHPGIRGDADAPADWGWDVEKPVCADDSYAEVTSLRKAPTVSDRAKGQATITFCLRILDCCRS